MNFNPDYEPKRDLWPTYEPWMRELLTDGARVSWRTGLSGHIEKRCEWRHRAVAVDQIHASGDLRIHPEDCPDTPPAPADPVEELAKVILEADTTNSWHWNELGVFDVQHYIDMAQAALDHIEAGEQS